jgi:hypothetical protein
MMSKKTYLIFIFFLIFIGVGTCAADKFGTSFSGDSMTQDTASGFGNQPSIPQPPKITVLPPSPATPPMPALITTTPVTDPGASVPLPSTSWVQNIKSLPSALDLKQLRIKTPEYEQRFQEMMRPGEEKAKAKKKTLFESILDEITRYGVYIVLGLVILTIFYALHKDKPPVAAPTAAQLQKAEDIKKKTIWDDEF